MPGVCVVGWSRCLREGSPPLRGWGLTGDEMVAIMFMWSGGGTSPAPCTSPCTLRRAMWQCLLWMIFLFCLFAVAAAVVAMAMVATVVVMVLVLVLVFVLVRMLIDVDAHLGIDTGIGKGIGVAVGAHVNARVGIVTGMGTGVGIGVGIGAGIGVGVGAGVGVIAVIVSVLVLLEFVFLVALIPSLRSARVRLFALDRALLLPGNTLVLSFVQGLVAGSRPPMLQSN